jgi:hypothetical protein
LLFSLPQAGRVRIPTPIRPGRRARDVMCGRSDWPRPYQTSAFELTAPQMAILQRADRQAKAESAASDGDQKPAQRKLAEDAERAAGVLDKRETETAVPARQRKTPSFVALWRASDDAFWLNRLVVGLVSGQGGRAAADRCRSRRFWRGSIRSPQGAAASPYKPGTPSRVIGSGRALDRAQSEGGPDGSMSAS